MADAVDPADLRRRLDAGGRVTVLDTRNRDEIDAWRFEHPNAARVAIPYAKLLSANITGEVTDLLPGDAPEPVVAVCGRGEASAEVARWLRDEGVDAVNLAGGMEGWARVYHARELDADAGDVTIVQYDRPSSGCLAYLVGGGDEAAVVDPLRAFTERYTADADGRDVELAYAVDTHIHADHISGVRDVAATTGATPVLSDTAVERGMTYGVESVADGDVIRVGEAAIEVVATPGHTSGMTSFRVGDVLLTGDTLFVDGIPRPDLESPDDAETRAAARELHRTLTERLAALSDDVVVAPGHYSTATPRADGTYAATLGELRERFDVFGESADAFVDHVLTSTPPRPANAERIVAINLGCETADDREAFELELGPNNCAAASD